MTDDTENGETEALTIRILSGNRLCKKRRSKRIVGSFPSNRLRSGIVPK